MNVFRMVGASAAVVLLLGGTASAQGFDCTKAQAPVERAICASPRVLSQDNAMSNAYVAALARDPGHAADIRQAQRNWLRDRATCMKSGDSRAVEACLIGSYTQRLAALGPTAAPSPAQAAAAPTTPAAPSPPATTPTPPAPRPVAETAPDPLAAPPAPAVAAVPAEATLDTTRIPSAARMETLLHVTHPGRFALEAHSASGTALQLVDMLTGPSSMVGQAGQSDGRLDVLLDVGTYKIRAFGAAGASGDATLAVTPFRDAAPAEGAPVRGRRDADLADYQQRRFWLAVGEGDTIRIEAAGRALGDLRLWRNGTELVDLPPAIRTVEPTFGHPLTDIVLQGTPEPGTYEVVAYGGKPMAWADGAPAMPFHIRTGLSDALAPGWISAHIGPFGSEIFRVGPAEGAFRLDLPEPASAELDVTPDKGEQSVATIAKNQRDPTARLALPPDAAGERMVEVRGAEGQAFQLRTLSGVVADNFVRVGTYWLSIDAFGLGGDEAPLAYAFTRRRGNAPAEILASSMPRVGPGTAWRAKFNLRAMIAIPFEVTSGGPIAVRADGVAVQANVAPFGATMQPRANGTSPGVFDLAPGFYVLQLVPARNAAGILDLTLGAPGVPQPAPAAPQPLDAALPIGLTSIEGGGRLDLYATKAGSARVGLLARQAPVDLFAGPLAITLGAGQGIDVPARLPGDGTLIATELGAGPVPVIFDPVPGPTAGRIGIARIAAGDHIRTVTLGWRPAITPPLPVPAPETLAPAEALAADTPRFLDLGSGGQHSFALSVPNGGLYRVETTGRLRTMGAIGTSFIPDLDHEEANGIGQNMLIQHFLRAGPYRLVVGVKDSAGHFGVRARPAAVLFGATLVPGGSVRARMAADAGEIFPIEISSGGKYHLDLLSQTADLTARLEDEEGWPLLPAGDLSSLDQDLLPGKYRLLVQPTGVDARVVARLNKVEPAVAREGHGPFPLAFNGTQRATWHEPAGRDDPRPPDRWDFSLAGPAAVIITVSDGMVAELRGDAADAPPISRFTHTSAYSGTLPAGNFHVSTMSLGRNDRLDYTVSLRSTELQPDTPRSVTLPASVPFSIAVERVISLTSFGNTPLGAVLRRDDGSVVERFGDRGDDWNIGISRRLPAGKYRLDLSSAVPQKGDAVTPGDTATGGDAASNADTSDDSADKDSGDTDSDQSMNDQGNAPDTSQQAAPSDDSSASDTSTDAPSKPAPVVELRLRLPATRDPVTAAETGSTDLRGGGVHVVALPTVPDMALTLVAASSSAELALALERRDADGTWRNLSTTQGTASVVGGVGDADAAPWRALVWAIDGGNEPIHFSARVLRSDAQPTGMIRPVPVPLDGFPAALAAARVLVPGNTPLSVGGGVAGVLVASQGRALAPPDGSLILPQSDRIWVVTEGRGGENLALAPVTAPSGGTGLALAVPRGGMAWLPGGPLAAGHTRVWRADSGLGQPGLEAGRGMGVANGSALALSSSDLARVFNAGGGDALRLRVTALDLADQTPRALDGPLAETLPPGSTLQVRLPEGLHRIQFDLAPGTAAIANNRDAGAITVWTGDAAVSRSIEGRWTDFLLVNTGAAAAPVALNFAPLDGEPVALAAGLVTKRFFGAAGSLDLPVRGDGTLVVAGGMATLIGADKRVTTGTSLAVHDGGHVMIDHGPGLLAAWMETKDSSPWPKPEPEAVELPQRIHMRDPAMALNFTAPGDMLLHVRSTAPVILALGQETPVMFAQGAEMNRAIPAGPASLRVISPHDGPLSGTLEITADPITPAHDGVGTPVAVAPGGTAAFGFTVGKAGPVGVGVRAEPDRLSVRLLDATGAALGEGVAQLQQLKAGRYVLEASVPPDATTTLVRPTIVGIAPRPNGPPPDVVNKYLALAGRAPVAVIPASAHTP